jgi:hypothetical protein
MHDDSIAEDCACCGAMDETKCECSVLDWCALCHKCGEHCACPSLPVKSET